MPMGDMAYLSAIENVTKINIKMAHVWGVTLKKNKIYKMLHVF